MHQKHFSLFLTALFLSMALLPVLPSIALAACLDDCIAAESTCLDGPSVPDTCYSAFSSCALVCPPESGPAAPTSTTASTELQNPLPYTDLRQDIGVVISGILGLTGVAALAMFVWGGMQWLVSGGNPDMVKKGKSTVTWAAIGLVVIFTSYALVSTLITALSGATT